MKAMSLWGSAKWESGKLDSQCMSRSHQRTKNAVELKFLGGGSFGNFRPCLPAKPDDKLDKGLKWQAQHNKLGGLDP